FRLRKKPEPPLPKNQRCAGHLQRRSKKMGTKNSVCKKKRVRREKDAENQQTQNCRNEPRPHRNGQSRQSHAPGAKLDGGHANVERWGQHSSAKACHAQKPQSCAGLRRDQKRPDDSRKGYSRHPKRDSAEERKSHVA